MMLSTEKDEVEEVDDLNNSTADRMYARLASLEVDRSILLEAFLISNWIVPDDDDEQGET